MKTYATMGIDDEGQVYGLEIEWSDDAHGFDWVRNSLGLSTSCMVVRPVKGKDLTDFRVDEQSVRDVWIDAVRSGDTDDGLREWFEQAMEEVAESCVFGFDEAYPFKDESWCRELLIDPGNPTIESHQAELDKLYAWCGECEKECLCQECHDVPGWYAECSYQGEGDTFRDKVDWLVEHETDFGEKPATWEAAGWWTPKKPFVVELGPRWLLDEYYKHLSETSDEFNSDNGKEKQE